MKIENIISKLKKESREVFIWKFDNQSVWFCGNTALVDVENGKVMPTNATYKDVIAQIDSNKSHIYNTKDKKKQLSPYIALQIVKDNKK